jgi:hypothetical protein
MAAPTDGDDAGAIATMLAAAERGEVAATPELFAALYRELHRVARRQLHFNAGGLTLGATTLLTRRISTSAAAAWRSPTRTASSPTRRGRCAV